MQLSPTTRDGAKISLRVLPSARPSIRSTSRRIAAVVISATGCSVRVSRGLVPPLPDYRVGRGDRHVSRTSQSEVVECPHHAERHHAVRDIERSRSVLPESISSAAE